MADRKVYSEEARFDEMARRKKDEGRLEDRRTSPIFIHSIIDDMTELSPNTMRVYMHLARRADKSGVAWPSYQSIGDHCFRKVYKHPDSRRKEAIACIAGLCDVNLVRKEIRLDEHGQKTNVYILLDPVTVQSLPPVTVESPPNDYTVTPPSDPAITPPVIVQSPKGSPVEGSPIEGTPMKGDVSLNREKDPIQVVWEKCRAELEPSHTRYHDWLPGSRIIATGEIRDGKPLYRLLVQNPRSIDWLRQQGQRAICSCLRSTLGPLALEIEIDEGSPAPLVAAHRAELADEIRRHRDYAEVQP